jgi:hypothetical protein
MNISIAMQTEHQQRLRLDIHIIKQSSNKAIYIYVAIHATKPSHNNTNTAIKPSDE